MIAAAVRQAGLAVDFLGGAVDDEAVLERPSDRLRDLKPGRPDRRVQAVFSKGDHDHVRRVLERRGATILLHGVRMRPGKPMLVAPAGGRTTVFRGLPGNPVAALSRFASSSSMRPARFSPCQRRRAIPSPPAHRYRPAEHHDLPARPTKDGAGLGSALVDTSLDQRSHVHAARFKPIPSNT